MPPRLRSMVRGRASGKASHEEASAQHRAMTNEAVLRHWRLVPSEVELRIRRPRWLQQLVRSGGGDAQLLATVLGSM